MNHFLAFSNSHKLGKELEGYLTNTIYNDYIPKGVPKNVIIAHKVGMIPESNIYNDVAIVKDRHPYILVVLTKDKKGPSTISGLSKIIHQEHVKATKQKKTAALKQAQVTIINNKGKKDQIKIKGINKKDKIKIYSSSKNGKQLASQASNSTSITISINQLGTKSGKIYITNTRTGMSESGRIGVSFKGEPSNPLKQSQVKTALSSNQTTKITISGVLKGDKIKVYSSPNAKKYDKQFTASSSNVIFEVQKKEKIYLSITHSGMLESSCIGIPVDSSK